MERDHGQAPAGRAGTPASALERVGSRPLELAVDVDAQGLEGARRGVEAGAARAAGAARRTTLGELGRGRDRRLLARASTIARAMRREARSSP